jgi:cysteine desulfurase
MNQTGRRKIYLDHAATTPVDPAVVAAMLPYFTERFGNPSSLHVFGQEAKRAIEAARDRIASFIGAGQDEIVFTGSGTESDNFALKGIASAIAHMGNHIITSKIEHHAVLETCKHLEENGCRVTYLGVNSAGLVDPDDVRRAITDETILISIMHANNEIGTIQPIAEIGKIARERAIYFHADAVQTVGHIPTRVDDLGVDLMSASAHKLYGPKGVGFIYIRKGTRIESLLHGGEQEKRRRASTQNVPGIVGLGKAIEIASRDMTDEMEKLIVLRDKLIGGICGRIESVHLNGDPGRRLPNNVSVCFDGVAGEALVLSLDMQGIACSAGSACTSTNIEPSHVLAAIGLERMMAHGSLRFSLGKQTTEEEVDYILDILPGIVNRLRKI